MIKKIRSWFRRRKHTLTVVDVTNKTYNYEQLKNAYSLGYNDGKRDGLAIAREQATKSLKEILWQQNQKQ